MGSDSRDAECLPDLKSLDDFLTSSFDPDIIVDDEDEVEGQENGDSLGLEPYRFEPFVVGAEHEDSDSESRSDSDTDSSSSTDFPDLFFVSFAFMAMMNHLFTTVAHCQLITGGRKTTLLSRRTASVTESLAV